MSSKQGSRSGRERSGGDWTGGEDRTTRASLAAPFGMGSCKRWCGRSIGECVRKYRRDAKERPDKEMAP